MLFPVDLERFWRDNAESMNRPFDVSKPQVPMTLRTTEGCIWEELGIPVDKRYYVDAEVHKALNRRYNDKAEEIVGLRILPEVFIPPKERLPEPVRLEQLFGSQIDLIEGSEDIGDAEWVRESVHTIRELEERMEYVASLDLRGAIFPEGFWEGLERVRSKYGQNPQLGLRIRGPVTAVMSVCGVENVILWLIDYPEVMDRLRDILAVKIVEYCGLLREATGAPEHGFAFYDDNCGMLNVGLYERFGKPILAHGFSVFSPNEGDRRYQHSDSNMAHLLRQLASVGLTDGNFGPMIRPKVIRQQMPRTVIHGQLPPFTFSREAPEVIHEAVRRDLEEAAADGGLVVHTAGSVNPGSKLEGLRAVMSAIQQYGRYRPLD